MGVRQRHDRQALHAQELLRRIEHAVDAIREDLLELIEVSPIVGAELTVRVTADHSDIRLHLDEPELEYPATSGVRVSAD